MKNAATAFFTAKGGKAAGSADSAASAPTAKEKAHHKATKAKQLTKAVNRAKQMKMAIPMWLTNNLDYFQSFHGQLHSAENIKLDVSTYAHILHPHAHAHHQ